MADYYIWELDHVNGTVWRIGPYPTQEAATEDVENEMSTDDSSWMVTTEDSVRFTDGKREGKKEE